MKLVRYKECTGYLGTFVDSSRLSLGFIHVYQLDTRTVGLRGKVKKGRAYFFVDEIRNQYLTILGKGIEGVNDSGIEEIEDEKSLKEKVREIEENSEDIK